MRLRKLSVCIAAAFACGMTCEAAPTLAHRWSFNGDYNDSIGGTSATLIGSAVGFNESNTAVVMSGNGNGAGSLNLGEDMLPVDVPEVTVEIWASQTAVKNWARIIDYGQDNQNYFTLTWCQGTDASKERAEIKKNDVSLMAFDNTLTAYTYGTMYHISVTFKVNPNGATSLRWMRRNVQTGALEHVGAMTVPGWTLADIVSPKFYIGHSQYTADADANATYEEVRVWSGALADEQLTASVLAGPDVLPDLSAPAVATARWTGTVDDDATKAGNWDPALPDADTYAVFSGDFSAQIPSGSTFVCAGVMFEDARLSADCDWRGLASKIKSGTLDLAGRSGAWHTTMPVADSTEDKTKNSSRTVTFADDAEVTVNLYGRADLFALTRSANPFVVTWDEEPANLAGLKFVTDAKSKKMGLRLVPDTKMVPGEEGQQVEKKGLRLVYLGGSVFLLR